VGPGWTPALAVRSRGGGGCGRDSAGVSHPSHPNILFWVRINHSATTYILTHL
jgi:hypothetical protein